MYCYRCCGRKKVYKMMGGYTLENCGGEEITCPLCKGEGKIPDKKEQESVVKEVVETKKKSKSLGDIKDGSGS